MKAELNIHVVMFHSDLIERYATLQAAVEANGENCPPSLKRERTIAKNRADSENIPNFEKRFDIMLATIKMHYVGVKFANPNPPLLY